MTRALLVIDVQEGMQPYLAHDGESVVARIASIVARARRSNTPVIYVQHDGSTEPGHPLAKGTAGHAIHHAIAPQKDETIIAKKQCSAFLDTDLDATLKRAGVDHLIVCGMQTEYCVDTTVRSAYEHGYKVTLVSDAHTTGDTELLKAQDIVAHHNRILGGDFAELVPAERLQF